MLGTAKATRWGGERHETALLALEGFALTGCRPSELLQAHKGDVTKRRGVGVVLHITEICANTGKRHPLKSVKNVVSRREIPLVGDAANYGERLLAFAKASPTDQIFAAFNHDKEKGRVLWFSQAFPALRSKAGLPESKVLYGLRHAYHAAMRNARVHEDSLRYLMGHAGKDVHEGVYCVPVAMAEIAKDAARVRPLHDYNGDSSESV